MWYIALRTDVEPRQSWTVTLDEHFVWMKARHDEGTILFSGPSPDIRTGIYVIRAGSADEAVRIAADDPFTKAGHTKFELIAWDVRQVLGTGPFSVVELDAGNQEWRSAWREPPSASSAKVTRASQSWTPGEMCFQLGAEVERYVASHCAGFSASAATLARETAALGEPAVMMIAKEQFALFRFLAEFAGWRRALDIGTFTGLSAMAFAEGMGPTGRVTTIDRNPDWLQIARRHWSAARVDDRIDVRTGEASAILADLTAQAARFDVVFIDVEKARVNEYFELAFELLQPGGLIMVDNALWHGWVMDGARLDADTSGMRKFNDWIATDPRVQATLLPIADGIWLIRRRGSEARR
jgi:predicted O-methyltransferase YrrM/uncharacterized protein YciI